MDRYNKPSEDFQSSTPVLSEPPLAIDVTPQDYPQKINSLIEKMSSGASSTAPELEELKPGQVVQGRYEVISFIGRGGIGSVYRVKQILLKKHFALKTLHPVIVNDKSVRRFQKEAQAASRLEHPNLVRAIDFGVIQDNQPFLVMEFVEGVSLAQYLKEHGRLGMREALQIAIPVCFAMAYAHQEGVIHRDIKPGNIVLVPGDKSQLVPKIIDFGIAKIDFGNETAQSLTTTGEVFGTPLYMSPEQCAGTHVDSRSDIYSLGCVLFESLTGAPPFRGQSALETMMQHGNGTLPSMKEASLGLEFPRGLEEIIVHMLAKNPQHRYQSCLDVARDLVWLQQGKPDGLKTTKRIEIQSKPPTSTSHRPLIAFLVALAACLACAVAGFLFGNDGAKQSGQLTNDADSSYFANWRPDDDFFSHVSGTERIFILPNKHSVGDFLWWDESHQIQNRVAKDDVQIPINAKAILRVGWETLTDNPYYLAHFRNNDLAGVFVRAQQMVTMINDDDMCDRAFQNIVQLRSLRLLVIRDTKLPDYILPRIGTMPQLHWLVLDKAVTSGAHIAELENLSRLRVFAANYIDSAEPILKVLSKGCVVRRLSLEGSHLTEDDISKISKLHSITELNLAFNFCGFAGGAVNNQQRQRIFAKLSKLPNLNRLCIEPELFGTPDKPDPLVMKSLGSLKNLSNLVFSGSCLNPAQLRQVSKQLPRCKVENLGSTKILEKGWFDPTVEDPALKQLW